MLHLNSHVNKLYIGIYQLNLMKYIDLVGFNSKLKSTEPLAHYLNIKDESNTAKVCRKNWYTPMPAKVVYFNEGKADS